VQQSSLVRFNDLGIADELGEKEFRNQFFRAEREIDIPSQLKTLRKFRGMTQKELAEEAGTKQSAISRIEKSQEVNWELETLVKLAEALHARLAVIIEPYEVVAARYRREAQLQSPSAATDNSAAAPPKAHEVPPNDHQASQQSRNDKIIVGEREGAAIWN
jgi:transcriptional regulator with XRE-family HTH domain